MKKYKHKAKVYIVSLGGTALNSGLLLFADDIISRLFLISVNIFAVVNMFAMWISYYELTERELILKGMFKRISINLDEIEQICSQPAGKFVKESIVVFSEEKRITITALTNGYLELISKLITALPNNEKVRIEEYIKKRATNIKALNR